MTEKRPCTKKTRGFSLPKIAPAVDVTSPPVSGEGARPLAVGCAYQLNIPKHIMNMRIDNIYGDNVYRYNPTIIELEFEQSSY